MQKLIYLIFSVLLATVLFASETRTFSLGQSGFYIRDNSNPMYFPGTIMYYNNEVRTELRLKDREDLFSGGVNLPFMETGYVVGVYLNCQLTTTPPFGITNNVTLSKATDVYFGMKSGGNNLGLRVSYAHDGFDQDSTAGQPRIEEAAGYIEIAGGLSNKQFDVGASVYFPSLSNQTGTAKDDWGGYGFRAVGRYFMRMNKKLEYVPLAVFETSSTNREVQPGAGIPKTEIDYSLLNFGIGGAMLYRVNPNGLIVLGIEAFGYNDRTTDVKDGTETSITLTTFPGIFIGGEARLASWLTGRIGAHQVFQSTTTSTKPQGGKKTEITASGSSLNFTFGLGIHLENFLIDLDLNEGSFFEGPYFISGTGAGRDLVGKMSVTYTFDKGGENEE